MITGLFRVFEFVDHTGETFTVVLPSTVAGGSAAGWRARWGTVTDGVILQVAGYDVVETLPLDTTIPTNPAVQNEDRWQVQWIDQVTNRRGSYFIPTADLSLLTPGSEILDITSGIGLNFKNFFETAFLSPLRNPIVVYQIQLRVA